MSGVAGEITHRQSTFSQDVIRVLIVAAVRLYREGMAASLDKRDRLVVVGTAANRADALDVLAASPPDVVVLDMTEQSADLVRAIAQAAPEVKTIVFAVTGDEREIVAFAEAGVSGYVPLDAPMDDLAKAIVGVTRGDVFCPPLVAATLLHHIGGGGASGRFARTPAGLTSREAEVLALIQAGLSNKEIAVRLRIEVATVKNHVHHLLEKLQVASRAEAAAQLGVRRPARR